MSGHLPGHDSADCEGYANGGNFRKENGSGYTPGMLFMVIEHFKNGDPQPVGERFRECGRMLPEGVAYHSSWVDPAGSRCFQIMEAPRSELLEPWVGRWDDLIDFEIIRVQTSGEFWADFEQNAQSR